MKYIATTVATKKTIKTITATCAMPASALPLEDVLMLFNILCFLLFGLQCLQGQFGALAGVGTKFTFAAHSTPADGRHIAFHTLFHFFERWVDPAVVSGIWNDFGAELNAIIKSL